MKSEMHKEKITTFPEFLQFMRTEHGNRPAILYENVTYTYEDLVSAVAKRVDYINCLCLNPGAHLGVIGSSTLDTLEWMLAVPASGHVVVMLPANETDSNILDICKRMDVVGTFGMDWDVRSVGKNEASLADITPENEAAIFLTSGTTGQQKGVVHTNASMLISVLVEADCFKEYRFCRSMVVLPLYHIFGAMTLFAYLFSGLFIYIDGDIRKTITDMPLFKPNFLSVVPGLLNMILKLSESQSVDYFAAPATVVCGGANVTEDLIQKTTEKGIRLITGYGMTESCGAAFWNMDVSARSGSVGQIAPGLKAKVEDGELLLSGKTIMKCYYDDILQTEATMKNGWLRTGDLVRFDEQGFLFITGRKKNLIILENGENVSANELEHLLLRYSEIEKCKVAEMTVAGHSVIGAQILPNMAVLGTENEDQAQSAIENIIERINAELPEYKQIRTWETVNKEWKNRSWKN